MKNKNISSDNQPFSVLKKNHEFLNAVINDIGSCILLLNKSMELVAFNHPMKNLFTDFNDQHFKYIRCGEAIGCAYNVEEQKRCGETSHCKECQLRKDALLSYSNNKPVYNRELSREFYKKTGTKELRHLRYSSRSFIANNEYYIMLIINDITLIRNQELIIRKQAERISKLEARFSAN